MDESLKVFAKQLTKNAEKQPGWVYLLVTNYLVLCVLRVPAQLQIGEWNLAVPRFSNEVWAALLTLIMYLVGDALDKITFKKRVPMDKRLYIGNLACEVDDRILQEQFASHGRVVSAKVVIDEKTRQSKGFGFVEMGTAAEAQDAIKTRVEIGKRRLIIRKDREWVDRYQPKTLRCAKRRVREMLKVDDGIYDVSMKILEKAKQATLSVHFLNEMAKFFRSLIVPGLIAAMLLALKLEWWLWSLLMILLAVACASLLAWMVYPRLKILHMTNLYEAVVALTSEHRAKIKSEELKEVRLFFWEGTLLASAPKPANNGVQPTAERRGG